jgi:tRNA A-37 threonylcarbamoyl transferase component Bud32
VLGLTPGAAGISHASSASLPVSNQSSSLDCFFHVLEESIPQEHSLGTGSYMRAFLTQWDDRPAVYLKAKEVDDAHIKRASQKTFNELKRMNTTQAHQAIEAIATREKNFYKIPFEKRMKMEKTYFEMTPDEAISSSVANILVSYEKLQKLSHLNFEGRQILPTPYAIAKNADGVPVGSLIEHVAGKNLKQLTEDQSLNVEQLREVFRQAIGELKVLHKNGFTHGDISTENIIVDLTQPNAPKVRLIDPNNRPEWNTEHADWAELIHTAELSGYQEHLPIEY